MPSRTLPSPAPVNSPFSSSVESHHERTTTHIFPPLAAVGFSLFITLSICFCKFNRKRRSPATVTSSSTPPQKPPLHEFSYSSLRKATASFSPENRLGQGGFGSVFRGTLSPSSGGNVAVKVMDSGSLQGEREFQNELFFAARLKSEHVEVKVASESDEVNVVEDYGSVVEEVESVVTNTTGYDESNFGFTDQSPVPLSSPEMVAQAPMASPETVVSVSPEMGEKVSVMEVGNVVKSKDWWWKQEGNVGRGKGKEYVMQWIGSEVKKERPGGDWIAETAEGGKKVEKKKSSKKLEWWLSLDEEKEKEKKKKKRRMVREWWKDEYRKELAKRMKRKKKKKTLESEFYSDDVSGSVDQRRCGDEELYRKKRRGGSSSSLGSSIDWWLDGLSGEQWRARRRNSQDSVKSCGVSSTPSMRGTMCYVAPECCGNNIDDVSEKSDVYSYGVLLLVLVSGRRPLEVTGPASEIMLRANLMSWARKLARRGRLNDLVDEKLQLLDKEQAVLCIKVALQCLQKSPVSRPSMKDVLEMLTGAISPPDLPTEFSPSPQTRFPFKTQRKHNR
ncbi:Protein kinase domain [Arabidopsis thaliana x Arabidopsis arenosa]|uniref:Protein kinase domain n=1 Tax=Arabidopsis thaliana x Arabidopsis arenosa TaxID=1240361 RepID=A0A8T1XGX6_9BRAS|nr:Protein kinase domain [Arabidopsis thaliana x Arabidopsis arenosa]